MHRDAAGRASPASVPAAGSLSSRRGGGGGGNLKREGEKKEENKGAPSKRWVRAERCERPAAARGGEGRPAAGDPRPRRAAPRRGAAHAARPRRQPPAARRDPRPARTHLHCRGITEREQPSNPSRAGGGKGEAKVKSWIAGAGRYPPPKQRTAAAAAGGARGPAELAGGGGRALALSGAG